MIPDCVRRRNINQPDHVGIVPERDDSRFRHVPGEQVLRPCGTAFLVLPGGVAISGQAVDEDDTVLMSTWLLDGKSQLGSLLYLRVAGIGEGFDAVVAVGGVSVAWCQRFGLGTLNGGFLRWLHGGRLLPFCLRLVETV